MTANLKQQRVLNMVILKNYWETLGEQGEPYLGT